MLFAFTARDASGEIRSGSLDGATPNDVARLLTSRGLQPLEIKPASAPSCRLGTPPAPLPPPPALVPDLTPPSRLSGPPTGSGRLPSPPAWVEPPPPPTPPPAAPPNAPRSPRSNAAQQELEKVLAAPSEPRQGERRANPQVRANPERRATPERRAVPSPAPEPTVATGPVTEPSLWERIHWQRALGVLGGLALVLVLVLGAARFVYREKSYQLVVTGKVELFGEKTAASEPSRLNTKVYLYFPELSRALRPDGRQFELEGGKLIPGQSNWTVYNDPHSAYDLRWNRGTFELRATLSAYSPPTTCRVTVRKLGYTRSRGEEFPLQATSSGILTGTAPPVSLTPSGRKAGSSSPRTRGEPGGEGRETEPMEDGP